MKLKKAPSPAVQAANTLTARWCSHMGGEEYALSGAGLWPLLALLASAADSLAAAELATVLGRPTESAQQEALEIIDLLRGGLSTTAASGIWTRKGVPLDGDWVAPLPNEVLGALTNQAALDRWADEQTGGLIDKFPIAIDEETLLVLASALTARVRWRTPFEGYPRVRGDKWPDDPGPADQQSLSRTTSDLSIAAVLDDVVTRVIVEGDGDVDVHLLLGTDQPPAEILGAGLRELSGQAQVRVAADTGHRGGPGLTVERLKSPRPKDILRLSLPSFEIKTKHDLLDDPDLFGLRLLTDISTSHLPRLSPIPLAISDGAQDVLARFLAEGFEAAAVTAFGAVGSTLPEERYEVTYARVDFGRPFGFLAVHRPSRLAVIAGWVKSPFQQD
ncbi:MAG TPA: serpin family protein [Mycobacterium sp.]|nr:serpin family protein [Mycobacterium sp.]